MNIHQLRINWKHFKQGLRSLWDLSNSEMEASEGDVSRLENIILSKYPHESDIIVHRLMEQLIESFNTPTDHDPSGLYQTSYQRKPNVSLEETSN